MSDYDEPVVPISAAMIEAIRRIGAVAKRDRNQQQNFVFRGVDAVVNAVGPVLRDVGLVLLPHVDQLGLTEQVEQRPGRADRVVSIARPIVTYRFMAADGSACDVTVGGEAFDYGGDKALSKAMSVAYRTMLLQVFAIPTDEPDPDAQTYEREPGSPPVGAGAPPPQGLQDIPDDQFVVDLQQAAESDDISVLRRLWQLANYWGRGDLVAAVEEEVANVTGRRQIAEENAG